MESNYVHDLPPSQPRTLRGPRPLDQFIQPQPQRSIPQWSNKFPKRQPRKAIQVVVPTKKFVPPSSPTEEYVYPPPRPTMARKESKAEIIYDGSLPEGFSSTKTIQEEIESEEEDIFVPVPPQKKKLPPRPVPKTIKKPVTYYSSEEEEEELDEEEILREFKLSRKKSVHDITLSDDEEESDIEVKPTPRQVELPHLPKVVNEPTKKTIPTPPPIPTISAPGYSSDEESLPAIPTICVPGGFSDDEEEEEVITKKLKNSSLYDAMYFGIRCRGCDTPLSGQTISTTGAQWHPRCFKCQTCKQNLEHIAFYEMHGLPYCALDYHEEFSPRCDFCKTPIEEHSISALGKTYHAGHFFCRECGKPFNEDTNFLEHNGHAYCEKDYYKQFGKTCKGCEEIITDDFLVALGGEWHKECFVCADCGGAFTSSTFLIKGGKPYCEEHYNKQRVPKKTPPSSLSSLGSKKKQPTTISVPTTKLDKLPDILPTEKYVGEQAEEEEETLKTCHKCEKSIQGRSLTAFGHDYHPLHFQCSQCNKLLSARITGKKQEMKR